MNHSCLLLVKPLDFPALLQALLSNATVEGYVRAFRHSWCRLCDREDGVEDPPQLAFRATLCCCAVKLEAGEGRRTPWWKWNIDVIYTCV